MTTYEETEVVDYVETTNEPTTTPSEPTATTTENTRENDYKNALTEIETVLNKYNLALNAEVIVSTNGNYPRVFLTERPTEKPE
jgi:hypothetical protein